MRNKTLTWCVALVVVAISATAWALPGDYGPKYWSPTEEVVTPHIKWAKPDARGPIKVLFIVYRGGMREVVELAQRMDIQYTVFACGGGSKNSFCGTDKFDPVRTRDPDALTDDLKLKLKEPCDVIVLGNVAWRSFPLIIQATILKKVKEGTSLVGFVPDQDDNFKRAMFKKEKLDLPALVPFKGLPVFAKYKDAAAWLSATTDYAVFGKGKILSLKGYKVPNLQVLSPGPDENFLEPKFVEYDYYLAWIGQLLRFAADRTPARISGADCMTADRGNPGKVKYLVSGAEGQTVTCAFAFRNDKNQITDNQEKELKLSAGGTEIFFDVPRVPAGRYFADLWVKEGGKVLAFGSSFAELTGDSTIADIDLNQAYRCEDKVAGKIKITARTAADGMSLVLRQRDTYGRMTAETHVKVPAFPANMTQDVSFELSGSQPLTIAQYLEAELRNGDEILDRKEKAFLISNLSPRDDIRYIAWCTVWGAPPYAGYHMFAELAKAGFDTHYTHFSACLIPNNIRHVPLCGKLFDRKSDWYPHPDIPNRTKDDHVRLPCLMDPAYRKELSATWIKIAEKLRPFSTTEFTTGDECNFVGGAYEVCFCPNCVAAFHVFLADEYRTVEAMNREYGTQYKSFAEVQPVTFDQAKEKNNLQPLWIDYRRHMENTWAGIYAYASDVIRKIVPEGKMGYNGSDTQVNSYRAADFYKLMKAMRVNGTYDGAFVPYAVVSFAQPGTLVGLGWYGGYNGGRSPEYQRYTTWRQLFRGANSFWIYTVGAREQQSGMAPDFSLYDFFKANVAEVQEIKRGIGKLLMTANRADVGVAILYSAASVHVSTLTEGLPQMANVLNALTPLFEDTGHQFRIVSYEQAADGELQKGGYKILWMPYVQALSRKEAAEIESFVRAGGTVIADLRPGVRDEHGKPYEGGGILDKVFGVKQMTSAPVTTNCDVNIKLEGYAKTLNKVDCDLSVGLGTGEAFAALAGGKPALIINRYEKGKAILLNFSLANYAGVVGDLENSAVKIGDDSAEIRELFKALMARTGMDEPVRIEPELARVRLYRFGRMDAIAYLGVLQELPEPNMAYEAGEAKPLVAKKAELKLWEKRHIYDSRQGKYLGCSDRIKTMIEPAKGMLFALLPYEVKGIKLNAPDRIGQGESLAYETEIEGTERPGRHVFHVELVSPKGDGMSYYAENIVGETGKGKGSVALALNETVGKWTIRIRDVATGATAEQSFSVEERK